MATRIFEIARDLGVTSKDILDKCRAEGLDVKNHMAVCSAGLEATIRDWFTEAASSGATVEETQHVDLEQARQKAKKQRRKGRKEDEETAAIEAATATAQAAEEAPSEEPAESETAVAVQESPAPAEVETAPVVEPPPVVEEPIAPPPPPQVVETTELPKVAATVTPPAPPTAADQGPQRPTPPAAPAPATVQPAGPQLIPRPARLQGPRVVRVEKPDFVHTPRRRPPQAPPAPVPTTPAAIAASLAKKSLKKPIIEEEEEAGKKGGAKKRSPRRRSGRSAESGEGLKEWRDQDLLERTERITAATGGLRRHRPTVGSGSKDSAGAATRSGKIEVQEPITVKSLSAASGLKTSEIIRKLMELGTMATINQVISKDLAESVFLEYGVELEVRHAMSPEESLVYHLNKRSQGQLDSRAPVVTFLGHVDHGKTSLLDRIRSETVASGEAGGITQHIGAYRFDRGDSHVVFLDTPGHEAFTAMRARGANMTDVVVLVVAADDGVMPQTIEALNHAKAAKVPIVVALNKIDMPNANETRVLGQLSEHGLQPREWGGNVEVIRTSAVTGQGIDTLVETLSLEAELLELKAENSAPANGFVIEARMDPGMGVLVRLLVRNGTLKVGDILLAGRGYGKVRQMLDHRGKPILEAPPSTPVEVSGLDEIPEAGDRFYVTATLDEARAAAEDRRQKARSADLAQVPQRTLESLLTKIEEGKSNQLSLIIKADVQGSIEAITGSIAKIESKEVRVNVLHAGVGGITAGDVGLAEASDALVIGFNVVPDANARQLAEAKGVDIRLYRIIYDILEDIRKAVEEGLAPEIRMETLGRAEIRQVFKVSKVGSVAGCFVLEGIASRTAKVRITRNNVVVEDERTLDSLKRFKDDAREVRAGMECGLKIAGYDDIKEGDVLEFYHRVEIQRKL